MEEDGWAGMPEELFEKVLEALQPDGPSKPEDGGLGFSQALAAVRLVCAAWKAVHDAMVTRLVLSPQTTDEAVGKLISVKRRSCELCHDSTHSPEFNYTGYWKKIEHGKEQGQAKAVDPVR